MIQSIPSPTCPSCLSSYAEVAVVAPRDREYFSRRNYDGVHILRCKSCASLYQAPWPEAAEMASLYPEGYQDYTRSGVPLIGLLFLRHQKKSAKAFVVRHGHDVAVLDYGCGPGFFLSMLAKQGVSDLAGTDFDLRNRREEAPYRFYDTLADIATAGRRFDVIRMNHVIEHLVDLDAVMQELASLLKPGGRIVGQTPKASHLSAHLFGGYWGALHYPYHTVIFSKQGLAAAAERWGLRVGGARESFLPTGWAMSLENMAKSFLRSSRAGRTLLYPAFLGAALPFAALDYLRGDSAVFDFELLQKGC